MNDFAVATDRSHSNGSQMNPQRLRRPLRARTRIGTTTATPIGPSTQRVDLRLLGETCAQWWRVSSRRSNSETDSLVSEEEVIQTFACWKEDLVGVTGSCGPVVDELLLTNVCDHGWDTEQYIFEVLVAGLEESQRKTNVAYRKVFAWARLILLCAAPRDVGDMCLVCSGMRSGRCCRAVWQLSPQCLSRRRAPECRSCVVAQNTIYFAFIAKNCPVSQCLCAQMMDLCKALGELHVSLEDLPLEQYRARDELPLVLQRPRGRADDCVILPADLETMDLHARAISKLTLRAAELRRLRNDFEDFFGTRRSQLICSAEIALPILMSWDLLVVDKPADASFRSDEHRADIGGDHSSVHEVRQSPLSARILLSLPP